MIEQLFGSKTRVKLLGLFYQNPNRAFYVREITRKVDEQINSVRRELANLLSIGIIKSDNANNKLYYEVDQSFDHYDALEAIFGLSKKSRKFKKQSNEDELAGESVDNIVNGEDENISSLLKSGNVRLLIYTGQFTRDDTVGIDLMMVGDINLPNLEHAISKLEESEKKDIRYCVFTVDEFQYRKQINDRFVSNLEHARKIVHIDRDQLL
jgi:hypothetical protein